MAIKKIQIKPPNNNYADVLHPETSADMVKMADGSTAEAKIAGQTSAHDNHLGEYTMHVPYKATGGSANTYTAALSPAISSYAEGFAIAVKIHATNTGASTLNVNSRGAKTIKKTDGSDVEAGDLLKDSVYTLRYNGTNFILQGEGGNKTLKLPYSMGLPIRGFTSLSICGITDKFLIAGMTAFSAGAGGLYDTQLHNIGFDTTQRGCLTNQYIYRSVSSYKLMRVFDTLTGEQYGSSIDISDIVGGFESHDGCALDCDQKTGNVYILGANNKIVKYNPGMTERIWDTEVTTLNWAVTEQSVRMLYYLDNYLYFVSRLGIDYFINKVNAETGSIASNLFRTSTSLLSPTLSVSRDGIFVCLPSSKMVYKINKDDLSLEYTINSVNFPLVQPIFVEALPQIPVASIYAEYNGRVGKVIFDKITGNIVDSTDRLTMEQTGVAKVDIINHVKYGHKPGIASPWLMSMIYNDQRYLHVMYQ